MVRERRPGRVEPGDIIRLRPGAPQYPAELAAFQPRLTQLFVRGDLSALAPDVPRVAVVGTRECTQYGERTAWRLAADLAREGVVVVSGLARGIDAAAHAGALDAGGRTIAVLAGGVDVPYPAGHRTLLDDVVAQGAAVATYEPGARPAKWTFIERNAIIAALSKVVVVVEAGLKSGALHTAHQAMEMQRAVGAVPGSGPAAAVAKLRPDPTPPVRVTQMRSVAEASRYPALRAQSSTDAQTGLIREASSMRPATSQAPLASPP